MAVVEQRIVGQGRQKIGAGRPAAAPAPEPAPEPAKGGKKLTVVLAVVVAVLVAAGVAGYFLVVKPGMAQGAAEAPPEPGVIVQIESMNINLADGHYLRLGLGLQLTADAGSEFDATFAKDAMISLLSGRAVADLTTGEGRELAREALAEALEVAYEGHVMGVYFTDFVTQ